MGSEHIDLIDLRIQKAVILAVGLVHLPDLCAAGDYPLVDDEEEGLSFVKLECFLEALDDVADGGLGTHHEDFVEGWVGVQVFLHQALDHQEGELSSTVRGVLALQVLATFAALFQRVFTPESDNLFNRHMAGGSGSTAQHTTLHSNIKIFLLE